MPDLMTHVLAAHGLRRVCEYRRGGVWPARQAALFYVGACLPDFLGRVPGFVFRGYEAGLVIDALHAPAFCLLAAYALTLALPEAVRRAALGWLAAGALAHYALDWLQKPLDFHGQEWLAPFSQAAHHLGLFWPDQTVAALPWLAGAALGLECLVRWRRLPRR